MRAVIPLSADTLPRSLLRRDQKLSGPAVIGGLDRLDRLFGRLDHLRVERFVVHLSSSFLSEFFSRWIFICAPLMGFHNLFNLLLQKSPCNESQPSGIGRAELFQVQPVEAHPVETVDILADLIEQL